MANVGTVDRAVRVALGIAFVSLFFIFDSPLRWLGLIGVIALVTALIGYCPLYSLLGISSCSVNAKR